MILLYRPALGPAGTLVSLGGALCWSYIQPLSYIQSLCSFLGPLIHRRPALVCAQM